MLIFAPYHLSSFMSLFIDVIESLSIQLKSGINRVLESEKKDQPRSIRKICDTCSKYLDYGELRYDKMEDGIREIEKTGITHNSFFNLLLAVMNESLDEDQKAIQFFTAFSGSSLCSSLRSDLDDFITIGKLVTLKQSDLLEKAGTIMVEKYSNDGDITDTLSNLYLKEENETHIPVFQRLISKAIALYPSASGLEGLRAFLFIKNKDYQQALQSFLIIRDRIEADKEHPYYDFNMASTYDSIAGCYLKVNEAAKTIEYCDLGLSHDSNSKEYKMGNSILQKKAEALIMAGRKEEALAITEQILSDLPGDEIAIDLKNKAIL